MLRADRIPTPLFPDRERKPIPLVRPIPRSRWFTWRLLLRLVGWIFRLIGKLAGRKPITAEFAAELRIIFETFGGLWVKAGQLLSLRNDLFPRVVCQQLGQMQYQAIGFPFDLALPVIEAELGEPLANVFDEFDPMPVAAASIAQVYRAHLRAENVWVAVKVQRPDVAGRFARDLRGFRNVTRVFQRIPAVAHMDWKQLVWEMEQIVAEELDYRFEAANMRNIAKTLRGHKVYIPKVFDYSGERMLIMEWIPGVLMSDFLKAEGVEDRELAAWMKENNIDRRKVGERLFLTFFRQLFEDNLFHADMHPGNIMLLRDSRFALIDLGSVGSVDATFLNYYQQSMRALGDHNYTLAVDYLFLLTEQLPPMNIEHVKSRVVRYFQAWGARTRLRDLPYHQKSISNMGLEAGRELVAAKVVLSWQFMKINRTWSTIDASLSVLMPEVNYVKLIERYFEGAQRRVIQGIRKRGTLRAAMLLQEAGSLSEIGQGSLRQGMLVFQGRISRAGEVLSVAARMLSWGFFGLALGAIYVLAFHHAPAQIPAWLRTEFFDIGARVMPVMQPFWWILVIVLCFGFAMEFLHLSRRSAKDDAPSVAGERKVATSP